MKMEAKVALARENVMMNPMACSVLLMCFLGPLNAQADPIPVVNSSGILTGVLDVDVAGVAYDVQFVDGTCASVFGECDVAHFDFNAASHAMEASQALLAEFFHNPLYKAFDDNPALTFGCGSPILCFMITPYDIPTNLPQFFEAWGAVNYNPSFGTDTDFSTLQVRTLDTSTNDTAVFIKWSPEDPNRVPELSTGFSLACGLLALVVFARRAQFHF
jgi:hypothetical protein